MKLDDTSEFGLIQTLRGIGQDFPASLLKSIGDDCATLDPSQLNRLVVTTDLLLENQHFRRQWTSPALLGRKSILVNLSDLAAMGAEPYACLLSLGLPRDLLSDFFAAYMEAFLTVCREFRLPLIGGDLSASERITISVTALGNIQIGEPIYRSGARKGDQILLIGDLGLSRLGLEFIEVHQPEWLPQIENLSAMPVHDPSIQHCLSAHLVPEVFVEPAIWLQRHGCANSMIDVSDGLVSDLFHILEESGVSAQIDLSRLPTIPGIPDRQSAYDYLLNGGEDYALLFTANQDQVDRLKRHYPNTFPRPRSIGNVGEGPPSLEIHDGGSPVAYTKKGFDHFR